jgi:hypothetical protein
MVEDISRMARFNQRVLKYSCLEIVVAHSSAVTAIEIFSLHATAGLGWLNNLNIYRSSEHPFLA